MQLIKDFLTEACAAPSPQGREFLIKPVLDRYFGRYCSDYACTGNESMIYSMPGVSGGARIMLDAHIDEIALMVSEVTEKGFLRVVPVGAVNPCCLVAKPVRVYGREVLNGIISQAPAFARGKGDSVEFEELLVDLGLPPEEVREKVPVGSPVLHDRQPFLLTEDMITGRGLDDRAGIAAMLECARLLAENRPESSVYFSCSTREEGPGAGALSSVNQIQPDLAIVIDVSGGYMPGKSGPQQVHLGKGPEVPFGNRINQKLFERLKQLSAETEVPIQTIAAAGRTGDDTEVIMDANEGVPCALISIPLCYMHTPVEVVSVRDISQCGALAAALIKSLDGPGWEELLCC